ncbi:unannotated protein [freshwater metagenome]|uniref:Unannotated protein n=1 Tax=freshwater metagenome TaxID=449393 RepID=A0A6J6KLW6_9ZZZZ
MIVNAHCVQIWSLVTDFNVLRSRAQEARRSFPMLVGGIAVTIRRVSTLKTSSMPNSHFPAEAKLLHLKFVNACVAIPLFAKRLNGCGRLSLQRSSSTTFTVRAGYCGMLRERCCQRPNGSRFIASVPKRLARSTGHTTTLHCLMRPAHYLGRSPAVAARAKQMMTTKFAPTATSWSMRRRISRRCNCACLSAAR